MWHKSGRLRVLRPVSHPHPCAEPSRSIMGSPRRRSQREKKATRKAQAASRTSAQKRAAASAAQGQSSSRSVKPKVVPGLKRKRPQDSPRDHGDQSDSEDELPAFEETASGKNSKSRPVGTSALQQQPPRDAPVPGDPARALVQLLQQNPHLLRQVQALAAPQAPTEVRVRCSVGVLLSDSSPPA